VYLDFLINLYVICLSAHPICLCLAMTV